MKRLGPAAPASPAAFIALFAFLLGGFTTRGQERPAEPPAAAPERRHDADESPLAQQMERVEQAMHFLRRSLKDPAQDEKSLEQVAIAEQACLAAKLLTPRMAAHVAETERAAFQKDYRKGMAAMLIEWAHLETALLDGDRDAAQSSWKKLDRIEEDGHDRFTEGE